ncbi:hypothetical protein DOTSEDRAFT_124317 [Dothistroma septosporum NZE10]|uniref:Indole-diterpene biosynthesis protein PaxU n=1 Tax=Dothistroma septosporum (strain NZE10 / CBS 128990) TaxID=675120 RepID=N1Q019_DOTSN|nr:hypothetical protein DOTSEDRAFT_124317 [Dothistroma septosporum NZE10]
MSTLGKAGIEGFLDVAPAISLYRPGNGHAGTEKSPSLIVLCTFMGAQLKHIAKYTQGYQKLFSHSAILLVQSSIKDTFASDAKQADRLNVAAAVIVGYKKSSGNNRPILLHAMSNGGGITSTRLATILKQQDHGKVFDRQVLDCQPSRPHRRLGIRAMVMQLPSNPVIHFIGTWILTVWTYCGWFLHVTLLGQEDIISRLRRLENDPTLFDLSIDRLYMYTKQDTLVPYKEVHEHAEEARRSGYLVKEDVFQEAPHCALVREDAARYWKQIEELACGPA